jgi:hypothetical protein
MGSELLPSSKLDPELVACIVSERENLGAELSGTIGSEMDVLSGDEFFEPEARRSPNMPIEDFPPPGWRTP